MGAPPRRAAGLSAGPRAVVRDHGEFLRGALHLRYLADVLVNKAVIVENERGASWSDIGAAADGITKQAAHGKWGDLVRGWAMINHRRYLTTQGSAHLARQLDAWYAELVPDEEFSVTSGLATTDPRNAVTEQVAEATCECLGSRPNPTAVTWAGR